MLGVIFINNCESSKSVANAKIKGKQASDETASDKIRLLFFDQNKATLQKTFEVPDKSDLDKGK